MTMKEVSVVIICLLLISVVRGEEGLTCEAGYGASSGKIFISGPASQCSGLSKITTEAECKLAAEYNSKNNIDKNGGFGGRRSWSTPPGCLYHSYAKKYYFNDYTKSTKQCSNTRKCICKPKTCIKCPINTYSEGGINPTCTPCPNDIPTTNFKTGQSKCIPVPKIKCEPGHEYNKADGITKKKTCDIKCPINTYSEGGADAKCTPCPTDRLTTNGKTGQSECKGCEPGYGIIGDKITNYNCESCKEKIIHDKKTASPGGIEECKVCQSGNEPNVDHTRCVDPHVEAAIKEFEKKLIAQKEKQNDLSIKNSRLWAKEQIRLQNDKIMQQRKDKDNKNENEFCKHERNKGTIIFPAIEIENEIEDKEDTTCIDTNRDELLKSFCSFRMDLDNLFQIQSIDKEAKTFWPNMCCKERKDKTLEACDPPKGSKIKRENIIPFALSQGGNYSRHNLYVEVADTIKYNGYLHQGMKKLLHSLGRHKTRNANKLVNSFFMEVTLCGPRIVKSPRKHERKLCELFIPYHHAMEQFYNLIEHLYATPLPVQTSASFLETIESKFLKRQVTSKQLRLGKLNTNMQQIMQAKPGSKTPKAEQQCNHEVTSTKWTSDNLAKMKDTHCKGSNHLDLSTTDVKNIAIHYLKGDISTEYQKYMIKVKESLRYDIKDTSCPGAPLFTAKDISIQQVNMDTLGKENEWVAVVNLNTKDENSYLQSELPYCNVRDYLIGAKVTVKAYIDNDGCCDGLRDYNKCIRKATCEDKLTKLKDKLNKDYSKNVMLTGTQYVVTSSHDDARRRRLLIQNRRKGDCRL